VQSNEFGKSDTLSKAKSEQSQSLPFRLELSLAMRDSSHILLKLGITVHPDLERTEE